MSLSLLSYILGFVILFTYLIVIIVKDKKIPESISATVYSLNNTKKWLFTIMMFLIAMLIAPELFIIMEGTGYEWLSFLTILGMLGVGADPLVPGERNVVHYASAVLMGVSSQIIVYMVNPMLMAVWIPYVVYTMYAENGFWNMLFAEVMMMIALLLMPLI